eukprot:11190057-Lingulodinium_polyedra.AAC.1
MRPAHAQHARCRSEPHGLPFLAASVGPTTRPQTRRPPPVAQRRFGQPLRAAQIFFRIIILGQPQLLRPESDTQHATRTP